VDSDVDQIPGIVTLQVVYTYLSQILVVYYPCGICLDTWMEWTGMNWIWVWPELGWAGLGSAGVLRLGVILSVVSRYGIHTRNLRNGNVVCVCVAMMR